MHESQYTNRANRDKKEQVVPTKPIEHFMEHMHAANKAKWKYRVPLYIIEPIRP